MWWPGDEGGWSTANLLLGKTSPAGRLPVTWGKKLEDYAATDPKHPERSHKGVDGKTTYSEGVNVGYRWFDKEGIAPLFAFGHGLSYTTFDYSGLKVEKNSDGGLDVKVNIKNAGAMASDEVPQVYLGAPSEIPVGVQCASLSIGPPRTASGWPQPASAPSAWAHLRATCGSARPSTEESKQNRRCRSLRAPASLSLRSI
jgi:beta-glucosidase